MFAPKMNIFFKKITLLFLFIVTLFVSTDSYGQNEVVQECQTVSSPETLNYFKTHKAELATFKQSMLQQRSAKVKGDITVAQDIQIKVHAIRYSNGSGGLHAYDLEKAFRNLNNMFDAADVNFILYEGIDYIDDSELMQFEKGDEKTLLESHYTPGILNVYFAEYLYNTSKSSICGYSDNADNRDIIVVKNSCSINDSTLAHEIGHILSLVHTHGISNTQLTTELVDGSNCDTDGDGICDTPADPGLSSDNVDNLCNYTGNATDANGDTFNPDTSNMMSYSLKACRTYFSTEQIIRMYAYFTLEKNRFTQPGIIPEIATEEEAETATLNAVKLYPNPVQNGNIYLSSTSIDTPITFRVINLQGQALLEGYVENNEINVNRLSAGTYILQLQNGNATVTRKFIK